MRIRNVKNKDEIINNSDYVIKDYKKYYGLWHQVFGNNHPIYLEIGMGKGSFIITKALENPDVNFVGIEKNSSVLVQAVNKIKYAIPNLRFINMNADEIDLVFKKEISLLYLNFSDPWPKKRHAKRRLTSEVFLSKYENIFCDKKVISMKTDNQILFEYSLISLTHFGYEIEEVSIDLVNSDYDDTKSEYEMKYEGKCQIKYVKVRKKS